MELLESQQQKQLVKEEVDFLQDLKRTSFKSLQNLLDIDIYNSNSEVDKLPYQTREFIQICQLLKTLTQDQFKLDRCTQMRGTIKQLLKYSQNYFQFLPLYLYVYLSKQFQKGQNIQKINQILAQRIQLFGNKHYRVLQGGVIQQFKIQIPQTKTSQKVNLFQNMPKISNINEYLKAIQVIEQKSEKYFAQFQQLVNLCCINGQNIKSSLKIKKSDPQHLKLSQYIRVMQKNFEGEIKSKKKQIFSQFSQKINRKSSIIQQAKQLVKIFLRKVEEQIQISLKQHNTVKCYVSDFIRGNCYFSQIKDLQNCINLIFKQAQIRKHRILQIRSRKSRGTFQVIIKILIHDITSELQLIKIPQNTKLDIVNRQFSHLLYQIKRSPLGCTFGIYLYLLKIQKHDFIQKILSIQKYCKDKCIQEFIKQPIQFFLKQIEKVHKSSQVVISEEVQKTI